MQVASVAIQIVLRSGLFPTCQFDWASTFTGKRNDRWALLREAKVGFRFEYVQLGASALSLMHRVDRVHS